MFEKKVTTVEAAVGFVGLHEQLYQLYVELVFGSAEDPSDALRRMRAEVLARQCASSLMIYERYLALFAHQLGWEEPCTDLTAVQMAYFQELYSDDPSLPFAGIGLALSHMRCGEFARAQQVLLRFSSDSYPEKHLVESLLLEVPKRAITIETRPSVEGVTHRREADWPRKLFLSGKDRNYGQHRNSFNRLIAALEPLSTQADEGILFLPFIEQYFIWGEQPGEAMSSNPQPIEREWVGILHVPFDTPDWFDPTLRPERFLTSDLWRKSVPSCRGIITLSQDLGMDFSAYEPSVPVLSLLHPAELAVQEFDPDAYLARPQVVQVGNWLRKLQAIHRISAPGHKRVMLHKQQTQIYLDRSAEKIGTFEDPHVKQRTMVSEAEYDLLLSSSVVLCLLYATAANNVVVECLARATPIIINPLPAVVEYLGVDYPLYACDEEDVDRLLRQPDRVMEAHRYLKSRRREVDLSYEDFFGGVAVSEWYKRL